MRTPTYEGIFVALIPQRGPALLELLRDVARRFLGPRDLRGWVIEYGQAPFLAGAVVFRLANLTEAFPWREGGPAQLAETVSRRGGGRCWALALEKVARFGEGEGWGEGVAFDRGERVAFEDASGPEGRAELLAWFGEQLALSENEVLVLFESCDQAAGVLDGEERNEDEVDPLLERARREFQRYRDLKEERERRQS